MRRRTILVGGGATLVAVAGGAVWRAADQRVFSVGQGPAYEPWTTWRSARPGSPLRLVGAAILAANPHNSQPWFFRVTETRIDLFADRSRHLGAIDPHLREMYIGLGCALENLLLAAAADGYAAAPVLTPRPGHPTHAARVELERSASTAPALYDAVPSRHTNRGPYDPARPVVPETLGALSALGRDLPEVRVIWFTGEAERRALGRLTVAATEAIVADEEQSRASARWFRFSWHDIQRDRDGLTIDAQGGSRLLRGVAKILPPLSRAQGDRFWLQATRDTHVATAAAYGLLVVRDARDHAQRMSAGRLWQRMHLWAAAQGLGMHPLNQVPERADREDSLGLPRRFGPALDDLVGDPAWQGLMPFRLGYPLQPALPSPRRPVTDVLL